MPKTPLHRSLRHGSSNGFSAWQSGFTLMELLVVIAIVAMLATMVFSRAQKVKERGDQARDISNLRQIGAAVLAYAGENNGQAPLAGGVIRYGEIDPNTGLGPWTEQIEAYIQGDRKVFSNSKEPHPDTGEFTVDYFLGSRAAYLEALEEELEEVFQPVRLVRVASTSRYVLVGKNVAVTFPPYDADPDNYSQEPAFGGSTSGSKPVPLFFADGHVKSPTGYDPELMTTTYEGTETSFWEM